MTLLWTKLAAYLRRLPTAASQPPASRRAIIPLPATPRPITIRPPRPLLFASQPAKVFSKTRTQPRCNRSEVDAVMVAPSQGGADLNLRHLFSAKHFRKKYSWKNEEAPVDCRSLAPHRLGRRQTANPGDSGDQAGNALRCSPCKVAQDRPIQVGR